MTTRGLLVDEVLALLRTNASWTVKAALARTILFNDGYTKYYNALSQDGRRALLQSIERQSNREATNGH